MRGRELVVNVERGGGEIGEGEEEGEIREGRVDVWSYIKHYR